jgi:hypothetical protein
MREHDIMLGSDYQSALKELSRFIKELNLMKKNAMRDLKEVRQHIEDDNNNSMRLMVESIVSRCNTGIEKYYKLKLDALKLHAILVDKINPKTVEKVAGKLSATDREDLSDILDQLRREKDEKYKK